MSIAPDDTIAALSSGPLPAGVAVLRVSGPAAREALSRLAGPVPEPRRASLRTISDLSGGPIDRGLVLFFPGPGSVTGEDLAEIHLHGGRAVVAAALAALTALPGIRLAEAGEFTRRAFANGRIDLTEAEGLADLLAAETEGQRRQALLQAGGAHRALYEDWSRRLLHARAMLEADFDFSDEDDVSEDVASAVLPAVRAIAAEIANHLSGASRGEILREGFRVALVGAPNAGKSSLLNALARREAAIVSDIAGTTRDTIEVALDLSGVPVRLIDTAGLRETGDAIEAIGVERARAAMAGADLVLLLTPAGEAPDGTLVEAVEPERVWHLSTKADLHPKAEARAVSVRTGAGLDALVRRIGEEAQSRAGESLQPVPTRERHRLQLARALSILTEEPLADLPPEIVAEALRRADDALGALTGRRGVEELLGVIFSEFCIGK